MNGGHTTYYFNLFIMHEYLYTAYADETNFLKKL